MTRGSIEELIKTIKPVEKSQLKRAQARLDDLTKPPGSLGKLEETAKRLAAIQKTDRPKVDKKRMFTMAGDHGVTREGVSAYPSEVTPQMVMNFLAGGAAINVLTRHVGAEIKVVDIGVDYDFKNVPGLVHAKVGRGTANFAEGPAMTAEEMWAAIEVGVKLANDAVADGVDLVGVGEMGIGNTTSASALLAGLTGTNPAEAVGRGTGVDDDGLKRKADVVGRGLEVNGVSLDDPFEALRKVGGFEIAGMVGVCLSCAANSVPIVIDGFIATSAALVALKAAPAVADYLFLSHLSQESGHRRMVDEFPVEPLLDLDMRLGEGTGAALAMTLIDASAKVISEMATFSEAGVSGKE